jgi:hypothetical protein
MKNFGRGAPRERECAPRWLAKTWMVHARNVFDRSPQTEKLVPQPHDAVALGFTTRNEAPIRSSM